MKEHKPTKRERFPGQGVTCAATQAVRQIQAKRRMRLWKIKDRAEVLRARGVIR
jgi:hypothetical protein